MISSRRVALWWSKLTSKAWAISRFSWSFLILALASFSSLSFALDTYSNTTAMPMLREYGRGVNNHRWVMQ